MTATSQIDAFLDQWPDAESGPAHIVLADSNLEDWHIRWCLGLCRAALSNDERDLVTPYILRDFLDPQTMTVYQKEAGDKASMDALNWYRSRDRAELAATIVFLEHLLTIPESAR